jgi:hypothetical protein
MGLIKTALIGAAVYGAIKYITKKDGLTGKSIVDDLKDKAPEWIDKAKGYKDQAEARYNNFANEYPE